MYQYSCTSTIKCLKAFHVSLQSPPSKLPNALTLLSKLQLWSPNCLIRPTSGRLIVLTQSVEHAVSVSHSYWMWQTRWCPQSIVRPR
jgi:hypothetical protein